MKNIIITFVSILAMAFSTSLVAQLANNNSTDIIESTQSSNAEEFPIIQNYKATKAEKKVIRKMKKFVTPKILGNRKHTAALQGKTVTVQLNLDKNGVIENLQIVKGYEPIIDQRVLDFVKSYDTENPLANSNINQPAIIQVEIPLVRKKQYMN